MAKPEQRVRIAEGGRIVLPADYRRALGVKPGDEVVLTLTEGEVRITTPAEAVRRAQARVRKYAAGRSLVDELIAERRRENESE